MQLTRSSRRCWQYEATDRRTPWPRARDGRALHLTLQVNDNAGVVLKVEEQTVPAAPRLALADDNTLHHLLAQLRLTLLHRADDHVTDRRGGHAVQRTNGQSQGDPELAAATTTSSLRHDESRSVGKR